jgi:hypothetical protein
MWRWERCIEVLVGKPEESWEDNVKIYRKQLLWQGVDWIDLAEGRNNWWTFVNAVINLLVSRSAAPKSSHSL